MWKPEEIRDAEYVVEHVGKLFGHPTPSQDAALRLATAILKHRSDYSEDCEPLPVDEAFAKEMGLHRDHGTHHEASFVTELPSGVIVRWWESGDITINGNQRYAQATRPQLRSLIESLGVQNNPPAREERE